jgi:nucleoside-diphosphate-sugar epimerase
MVLRFHEDDVCHADLERRFRGVDAVVHLAAATDAASSAERKEEVERVNHHATSRVAEACAACGCGMLFVSTTSVYGTQGEVVDESCPENQLHPQSPYAESKLAAEGTLERLGRERGLRFVTCRFGTVFGPSPGMRFHTAVNKFIWQACLGRPVTVWRTALHQKRPYLDLEDAVGAIRFLIEGDRFAGKVYNVLTLNATVAEVLEEVRRHAPRLEVRYVDSAIMNQLSYDVDNRKFAGLGYAFRGDLGRGIGDTFRLLRGLRMDPES